MRRPIASAIAGSLILAVGPVHAQATKLSELTAPQRIAGPALEELVKGAAVYSTTANGVERQWVDAADGTLAAQAHRPSGGMVGTTQGSGTWRVEGDRYCVDIAWKAVKEAWCAAVYKSGDQYYTARGDSPDAAARPIRFER